MDGKRATTRSAAPTRAALADVTIRRLVIGFGAITAGEWVLGTVVAIRSLELGGVLAVGLVGFRFAPAAATGLAAALLPERMRPRDILTATALLRALAALAVTAALALDLPFAAVLPFVWLDAMVGSAYRPAQAVLLPAMAHTRLELAVGTSLISNVKTTTQLFGPLAGGVLAALAPAPVGIGVAAALYLVSGVLATRLPATDRLSRPPAKATGGIGRFAPMRARSWAPRSPAR